LNKKALDKEGVVGRAGRCVCICGGGGGRWEGVKPFSGRSKPVSECGLVWFGFFCCDLIRQGMKV